MAKDIFDAVILHKNTKEPFLHRKKQPPQYVVDKNYSSRFIEDDDTCNYIITKDNNTIDAIRYLFEYIDVIKSEWNIPDYYSTDVIMKRRIEEESITNAEELMDSINEEVKNDSEVLQWK